MNHFPKFTRCFYTISKSVFKPTSSPFRRKLEYFGNIFILIYACRLFFIIYALMGKLNETQLNLYRQYDLAFNYFYIHSDIYDSYVCVLIFLFGVFDFTCQVAVYRLNTQSITWQWWYELVVQNQDDYYAAGLSEEALGKIYLKYEKLFRLKLEKYFKHFLPHLLPLQWFVKAYVWFKLEDIDQRQLFSNRLKVVPKLSSKVRSRVLLFLLLVEKLWFVLQIGLVLVFWTVYPNIAYHYDGSIHPWYSKLWFQCEVILVFTLLLRLCRSGMWFTTCTILGTIVYTGHVIDVGNAVRRLITKYHKKGFIPFGNHKILYTQLAEHNLVCYLVICGSIELFGSVLIAYILTNLPINVYLISQAVFNSKQPIVNQLVGWLIGVFQLLAAAVVFVPLAWCCEIYHSPKKFIPKLQPMLQGRVWLLYKLKYDDLYNRLMQGPKMAVSIGPLQAITYSATLEFLFIYIAYLLMSFKQILG